VTDSKPQRERASHVILWIARGWSILSLVFVGSILAGEVLHPTAAVPTTPRDLIGLALFPFGTCLGMLAVYSWEALGGAMNVGSLLGFYLFMYALDGRFPAGPFFVLVAAPGALFLAAWFALRWLVQRHADR
jgi:hypothetical protein